MTDFPPCDQCGKPGNVRYTNVPGEPVRCWDHAPRVADAHRYGWLPDDVAEPAR